MNQRRLLPRLLRSLAFAALLAPVPARAIEYFPLPDGYHWWARGGGGLAEGPDGNLWASGLDSGTYQSSSPAVARVTPAGVVTLFPLPAGYFWWPSDDVPASLESAGGGGGITAGPDGAMWFTGAGVYNGHGANVAVIGRIAVDGTMTLYSHFVGWSGTSNGDIAVGADGNLWFTGLTLDGTVDGVGRATTAGVLGFLALPGGAQWSAGRSGIAAGSDSNLWISGALGVIAKLTTGGTFTTYALPSGSSFVPSGSAIAAGADGALWASGLILGAPTYGYAVARISTAGDFTLFPLPAGQRWDNAGSAIAPGPDGNLWFAGMSGSDSPYPASFAHVATDGSIATFPLNPSRIWGPAGANRGVAADVDGNVWFSGVMGVDGGFLGKMHRDAVANPCDDDEPCTADSGDAQSGCTSLWQPVDPSSCFAAGHARLKIVDPTSSLEEPKLTWLWQKGAAVDLANFGSSPSAKAWGLCVWDNYDSAAHLVAGARIDAGSASWRDLGDKGWSYRDRSGTPAGALSLTLKPGTDGRSLVKMTAGGPSLEVSAARDPMTYLRLSPSAVVQLVNVDGTCWSSEFSASDVTSASTRGMKALAK